MELSRILCVILYFEVKTIILKLLKSYLVLTTLI